VLVTIYFISWILKFYFAQFGIKHVVIFIVLLGRYILYAVLLIFIVLECYNYNILCLQQCAEI